MSKMDQFAPLHVGFLLAITWFLTPPRHGYSSCWGYNLGWQAFWEVQYAELRQSTSRNCAMPQQILNSWKEIAQYVGRGVRTVQRWERELGFPVRRPRNHQRSAVIAFPDEIDRWLKRAQSPMPEDFPPSFQAFRRNTELLALATQNLAARREVLRERLLHTIQLSQKIRNASTAEPRSRSRKKASAAR